MMESIEKLRESLKDCAREAGVEPNRFDTYWITARACDMLIDEIEAEIESRYMLLPVDADGVPIRVGDTIEYPNGRRDVVRFITVNDNMSTFNERGWVASKCRHVKPRTIEDVLIDMLEAAVGYSDAHTEVSLVAVEKYADEIRELMEVDR